MSLFPADDVQPPGAHTYGVAELSGALGRLVRGAFPAEIWVRGEIRNLSPKSQTGRHRYFALAEPGTPPGAQPNHLLNVVLFESDRERVNATLRSAGTAARMADGVEIRARGRVDWWAKGGRLQFLMTGIDPVWMLGRLEQERARVRAALGQEGLLDRNAGRAVPTLPLRVGLVTSAGSAAAADFLHELEASGFAWQVLLADTRVQGLDAHASIAGAMALLERRSVDVIALVRGGGARTDLATFDHEHVARAVATCGVPVFTGIGHEIDRTLTEEVAHTGCKTPTACAAALVETVRSDLSSLTGRWSEVAGAARTAVGRADQGLTARSERLVRLTRSVVAARRAAHEVDARRLHAVAAASFGRAGGHVDGASRRLIAAAGHQLRGARARLDSAEAQVRANDPVRVLARGWSITRGPDGKVVRRLSALQPGDELRTTLAEGAVRSEVTAVDSPSDPSTEPA